MGILVSSCYLKVEDEIIKLLMFNFMHCYETQNDQIEAIEASESLSNFEPTIQ